MRTPIYVYMHICEFLKVSPQQFIPITVRWLVADHRTTHMHIQLLLPQKFRHTPTTLEPRLHPLMRKQMRTQIRVPRYTLLAYVAFERFLARMQQQMLLQVIVARKRFFAHITTVRFLLEMILEHMGLQRILNSKRIAAHRTYVIASATVTQHMPFNVRMLQKLFRTNITFIPFAVQQMHATLVIVHGQRVRKHFRANVALHIGYGRMFGLHVRLEGGPCLESGIAKAAKMIVRTVHQCMCGQSFCATERFRAHIARKRFPILNGGVLLGVMLFEPFRMFRCERTVGHRTFVQLRGVQLFVIGQTVRLRKRFVAQIARVPDVTIDVNVLNVFL